MSISIQAKQMAKAILVAQKCELLEEFCESFLDDLNSKYGVDDLDVIGAIHFANKEWDLD